MENTISSETLSDSIVFQEKSIVSKIILKKPNGNITLFAFDKEESLTEHTSPYEAYIYVLTGSMLITVGGNPHTVNGGEHILLPANIPHALVADQPSKTLLVMIK
ncbi:MAG: cupin domain-containing protein [Ignavibacteriales bacterium]|nr:cupin domain-containing protein [Ignavibacteriales bacterium]